MTNPTDSYRDFYRYRNGWPFLSEMDMNQGLGSQLMMHAETSADYMDYLKSLIIDSMPKK